MIAQSIGGNRISINLGKNDRHFLFINLTIRQIYQSLEIENKKGFSDYTKMELAQMFFNTNKQYPVLKVRVQPYEGYIAPTENIIHDGSTEESNASDISFTVRGNFNISKLKI